jgi:hypothetical protein
MRVPSLDDTAHAAAVVSIMIFTLLGSVSADVGGGKGYPATPWRRSAPTNIQDLEKAKVVAAEYQTLSIPGELVDKTKNELFNLYRVSLRAEKPREGDTVGYALLGKSGSGETVSLCFSQIENFIVTSKTDKTITMSVTVWPDISPNELIEKQPTYKQLRVDYKRNVILEMSLRSADGRLLVFAGGYEYGLTLPIEKLTIGTKGNFYGEHPHMVHPLRFWWAIPSVANDADYPYRMIPAK